MGEWLELGIGVEVRSRSSSNNGITGASHYALCQEKKEKWRRFSFSALANKFSFI